MSIDTAKLVILYGTCKKKGNNFYFFKDKVAFFCILSIRNLLNPNKMRNFAPAFSKLIRVMAS